MKLLRLDFTNFQSYKEEHIDFTDLTTCGIIGKYTDNIKRSNGCGKSTIFDAILYALFGKARSKNPALRLGEKKLVVSLEYQIGDVVCSVCREEASVSKLSYYETRNGVKTDLTEDKRATQEKIINRLGASFDLLLATLFFQQDGTDKFTASTPTERKDYLKEVFNLESYDKAYDRASKKLSEYELLLTKVQGKQEYLKSLLLPKERVVELQTYLGTQQTYIQADTEELERYEQLQNENKVRLEKRIKAQNDKEYFENRLFSKRSVLRTTQHELEQLTPVNLTDFDLKIAEKDLAEINVKKQEMTDKLLQLRDKMIELKTIIAGHTKQISEMEMLESECPTCMSELDERKKALSILKLHRKSADCLADLKSLEEKTKFVQDIESGFRNQISNLELQIKDYNKTLTLKERYDEKYKIYSRQIAGYQDEITELQAKLDEIVIDTEDIQDHTGTINAIKDNINVLRDTGNKFQSELNSNAKTIDDLDKCIVEVRDLENRIAVFHRLKQIFGKNGIIADIIGSGIQDIEDKANLILNEIFEGQFQIRFDMEKEKKTGGFKDSLEIIISTVQGERFYESFSRGERTCFTFAIRMAISELLSQMNSVSFGCVFLDEIFANLDEFSSDKIVSVLNYLKTRFNQIFVISHTEIKDSFPNLIRIEKDARENLSRIVEVR